MSRYVTVCVTAKVSEDVDLDQLGQAVHGAVEGTGSQVMSGVAWAPDPDTIADALGAPYADVEVITVD